MKFRVQTLFFTKGHFAQNIEKIIWGKLLSKMIKDNNLTKVGVKGKSYSKKNKRKTKINWFT